METRRRPTTKPGTRTRVCVCVCVCGLVGRVHPCKGSVAVTARGVVVVSPATGTSGNR